MPLTEAPEPRLNQTEIDHEELNSTVVSSATARCFSWAFVMLLTAVPLSQFAIELSHGQELRAFSLLQPFGRGVRQLVGGHGKQALETWRSAIRPETLHGYEATLESDSVWKNFFQAQIQELLSSDLGNGNEKVILGTRGWLFFQHGLEYVMHQSITDPSTLEQTARTMVDKGLEASPHPDPRPVFLELYRQCREAGIHLIVLPVPDKVMLQPMQLYSGYGRLSQVPVPNNEGYAGLVRQMKQAGVDWFDVTPSSIAPGDVRYLVQDTHWTPAFMDTVAEALAVHIRQSGVLPTAATFPMQKVEARAARVGDLVDMLKLPSNQTVFSPQTVIVQKIVDAHGQAVQPDAHANVLLLGDSFTNIYSMRELGWGTAAGFGEHLAYHLKQQIDVIAFNGGGPLLTRTELAREENSARLGFKKVIVYEFAMRDLLAGNWKPISMVRPVVRPVVAAPEEKTKVTVKESDQLPSRSRQPLRPVVPTGIRLTVVARIVQTSKVPTPGSTPYKDCLTFIKVKVEAVEDGQYANAEMLVAFLALKDNRLLVPASYVVGDRLRLTLVPLEDADPQIRNLQRADDTDDFTLRPYYVISESRL